VRSHPAVVEEDEKMQNQWELCGNDTVFPVETLNPSRAVNQLLFAGEKRMAIRAYFDLHIADSRESFKRIATST